MKNRLHSQLKAWALLTITLGLSLLPCDMQAVQRPPERTVVGVVESVDPATRSLILKPKGDSTTPLKLGIGAQTVIRSREGKRAPSSQITPGTTITVHYRTHLLGIPQTTRIALK